MSESHDRTVEPGAAVAVVLVWRGRVGLFKRSRHVGHDAGRWHCLTGVLEEGASARVRALLTLFEGTGIAVAGLVDFHSGPVLELQDAQGGRWRVHTFRAATERRRLRLKGEYETYRWVPPRSVTRFDGQAPWLREVLAAMPA
ncbi:NUDIX domain-containing protein [Streptomyces sp. NPDC021098]|uniref:NUDIX domain-containing protein n=1 Tax=unclassified Streptomyces TaxID=2593676 RepID=UPI0037936EF2